ncbi:hypothetical protein KGQ20_07685 [Catenulispora sp. NF23]|uniref:Uncharacterized protein n=1 Tax=Catenulispora pinistramenti TaxID=2705254 RepID=A0ABS5KNG2_9ACTN|nr:hypothetical protein [Catenulispora pinistramenti]MBS2532652.1 hypothetical protein [Catenulispora pinistramenti]MBS2547591.1 hypothetical protein [Catenulispora pinistramenti]
MDTELTARLAGAVAAVPDIAYLSPHPRALFSTVLARGDTRGGGVSVHDGPAGMVVEVRVALRRNAPALATVRAVRSTAEEVLAGYFGADKSYKDTHSPRAHITVTVTAII